MECEVCASTCKSCVTCTSCDYVACRTCLKRCVEDVTPESPQCPNCHLRWTEEQTRTLLSAHFVDTRLRTKRRRLILARERSRFPLSAPDADRLTATREINDVGAQLAVAVHEADLHPSQEAANRCDALRARFLMLHRRMRALSSSVEDAMHSNPLTPCGWDGCMGTARDGVCMRCQRHTCTRCAAPLDGDEALGGTHVCDPDAVRTLECISTHCRACPNCHVLSVRAEGCPVMWCTHCHVFWNWNTLKIISHGRGGGGGHAPHNPDHREWLASDRRGMLPPREVQDVPCGGIPTSEWLRAAMRVHDGMSEQTFAATIVLLCAREAVETAQARLRPSYPVTFDEVALNHDLRVQYLVGDIDDSKLEAEAERRLRRARFHVDVGFVAEAFVFSGIDILVRACHGDDLVACALEMLQLTSLTNEFLTAVSKEHRGRRVPVLSDTWRWNIPYARAVQ